MDNYVYILDGKAYVNLTNRCGNACAFCIRNTGDGVGKTPLWLDKEPTADEVTAAFFKLNPTEKEVVFCGFGEPTERLDLLKECAARFKALGYSTRLNTNGLGSLSNGRNIAPELKDIDVISVSLNNHNAQKYLQITNSKYGLAAFDGVIEFAEACKREGHNVVFTVVDVIGEEDIEKCKVLCKSLDIPLRVREYVADNYRAEG